MKPTREQLIEALYNEYVFLCHDDFDPDEDMSIDEYLKMLQDLSLEELIEETGTDDIFTLDQFMEAYG